MTTGLIVGKFYPFHKGHDYLINFAKKRVGKLVVVVCEREDQYIAGEIRAEWIKKIVAYYINKYQYAFWTFGTIFSEPKTFSCQ